MIEVGGKRDRAPQWSGDWSMTDRERAALSTREVGREVFRPFAGRWAGPLSGRPRPVHPFAYLVPLGEVLPAMEAGHNGHLDGFDGGAA